MATEQIFDHPEYGAIGFIDKKENVHSVKAKVSDIKLVPGVPTRQMASEIKKAIVADINK